MVEEDFSANDRALQKLKRFRKSTSFGEEQQVLSLERKLNM
jgi:hypothetical protein